MRGAGFCGVSGVGRREQIGNRIAGRCGAAAEAVPGTNGTFLRAISLIYGRFGGLRFAKWLIYGTETRMFQVQALQFRAPYSRYHDLGAIYKPPIISQLPESAIHKPSSAWCVGVSPRFRTGMGAFCPISGMGCPRVGRCSSPSPFSDRFGRILSENGDRNGNGEVAGTVNINQRYPSQVGEGKRMRSARSQSCSMDSSGLVNDWICTPSMAKNAVTIRSCSCS